MRCWQHTMLHASRCRRACPEGEGHPGRVSESQSSHMLSAVSQRSLRALPVWAWVPHHLPGGSQDCYCVHVALSRCDNRLSVWHVAYKLQRKHVRFRYHRTPFTLGLGQFRAAHMKVSGWFPPKLKYQPACLPASPWLDKRSIAYPMHEHAYDAMQPQ